MSELSILELETEHAEVLPEREALSIVHGGYVGGHNHVSVHQTAIGIFADGEQYNAGPTGPELSSRLARTQCPGPGQLCTADPSVWIAGQNTMPAPHLLAGLCAV